MITYKMAAPEKPTWDVEANTISPVWAMTQVVFTACSGANKG